MREGLANSRSQISAWDSQGGRPQKEEAKRREVLQCQAKEFYLSCLGEISRKMHVFYKDTSGSSVRDGLERED